MSSTKEHTSSGTARTLLNPFLKTTKTRFAPQRNADVAQSKAVSPAPKTTTVPCNAGSCDLHLHIPKTTVDWLNKYKNYNQIYFNQVCWQPKLSARNLSKCKSPLIHPSFQRWGSFWLEVSQYRGKQQCTLDLSSPIEIGNVREA